MEMISSMDMAGRISDYIINTARGGHPNTEPLLTRAVRRKYIVLMTTEDNCSIRTVVGTHHKPSTYEWYHYRWEYTVMRATRFDKGLVMLAINRLYDVNKSDDGTICKTYTHVAAVMLDDLCKCMSTIRRMRYAES
jgi:hypothetical protein